MRSMSAALVAALAAPVVRPVILAELDWDSGFVRVHSGIGTLTANDPADGEALSFLGVGALGGISGIETPEELRAVNITMQLSGIPTDYLTEALTADYQGRAFRVFLGALAEDETGLVNDEIVPLASGYIDNMDVDIGETATIIVNCRNALADWERPNVTLYSDEAQQRLHPGDTFCSRIAVAAEGEITWQT